MGLGAVITSILLLIDLVIMGIGIRNVVRASGSSSWPKVPGIVAQSESGTEGVFNDREPLTRRDYLQDGYAIMYVARLRFAYSVNGQNYSTDKLHFGQTVSSGDSSEAQLRLFKYPLGSAVTVSYDPANPSTAAVEPGLTRDLFYVPGAAFALMIPAIMGLLFLYGARGRVSAGGGPAEGLSNMIFPIFVIFSGVFMALGLMMITAGIVNLLRANESTNWPSTPGQIVYGRINQDDPDHQVKADGLNLVAHKQKGVIIIYKYSAGGKAHYSNRRLFGQVPDNQTEWADALGNFFYLGREVPVFYDPKDPDRAVLTPGIAREAMILPGFGAGVFLFSLVILAILFNVRKSGGF
jgi:Protein of unknown function (DUF3592)